MLFVKQTRILVECINTVVQVVLMNLIFAVAIVQSIPLLCPLGKFADDPQVDTVCKNCPSGKYRDDTWWNAPCTNCPEGKYSGEGNSDCADIPAAPATTTTPPPAVEESTQISGWATSGIGVVAGASVGVAYYAGTT